MPVTDALRWAFQPGKSTKTQGGIARGVGLKHLKSFIEENGGRLDIYSDNGRVCISKNQEIFKEHSPGFRGTLVQVTLRCDENDYTLPSEQDYDSTDDWF